MSSTPIDPDTNSTQTFGAIDFNAERDLPLMGLSQQDRAAITALPPGTALLLVGHGPTTGARFLLDSAETTVGRHPHADIFLDDVTVSRKHAMFLVLPDGGFAGPGPRGGRSAGAGHGCGGGIRSRQPLAAAAQSVGH